MTYKPKRPAAPRVIFDAASALAAAIEQSTKIAESDRDRWYNALTKAVAQLMDGVRWETHEDGSYTFPSRSRSGLAHRVNGACTCEAAEDGAPCWHRAAKQLICLITEAEQLTIVQPPTAPGQCPRCAAPMFLLVAPHGNRHICPACQHSRPALPPAQASPRPAQSAPAPATADPGPPLRSDLVNGRPPVSDRIATARKSKLVAADDAHRAAVGPQAAIDEVFF